MNATATWCVGPDCPHPADRYSDVCDAHYKQRQRGGVLQPLAARNGRAGTLRAFPPPSPTVVRVMRLLAPHMPGPIETRRLADAIAAVLPEPAKPQDDRFRLALQRLIHAETVEDYENAEDEARRLLTEET